MATTVKTKLIIRNDVAANWTTHNPKLSKGEVGLETDTLKMKVGNGTDNWNALPYYNDQTNTYQDNITTNGKHIGDVAVVTGTNNIKTAYVWNGTAWTAMDGNYNAENIIIEDAITLAGDYTAVGNYKKGDTIAAGTTLSSVLSKIFTKTLYPSKPTPSVSMSLTNAASLEVGSEVTPSFSVTFDPKTYTYGSTTDKTDGSTTGCAPTSAATITDSGNATITVTMNGNSGTASGTKFTVVDNTSYYGSSVKVSYSAGRTPVNNLDQGPDEDAEGKATLEAAKVGAGEASNGTDTSKITGFRYSFKYAGTDNTTTIDDEWISGTVRNTSTNCVKNYGIGGISVAAGDKRVMFAVPGTSKTLKSIIDVDGMGLDIKDKFTKITKTISGKVKGSNTTTYTIWYFENADGFKKTTMNVTFN